MATLHRLGVRLTPAELDKLHTLAEEEDRSYNWIMRDALKRRYDARKPKRSYTKRAVKESA